MSLARRVAVTAALAAVTASSVPALAHAPRDERAGAPRMDLEVLVTPALTGRTSPGGTDAAAAVDGFGNRVAVARKEDVGTAVGVDPRARAAVRAGAWQWLSVDDGASWSNLETLPRGAEVALPQGTARDVAASGARTVIVELTPAGAVLSTVRASGRGKLVPATPVVVPVLAAPGSRAALAVGPLVTALVTDAPAGGSQVHASQDGGATWGSAVPLAGRGCESGADPRAGSRVLVVACLEATTVVLHTSKDGGRTFARRVVGAADLRGGDGGSPSVDVGPDGTPHVLSGLLLRRVTARGVTTQDLRVEGGAHRATVVAVSRLGRVSAAAYRKTPEGTWNVVVTLFSPGRKPVWSNFAFHDPAAPEGAAAPPSTRLALDFDERARLQLLWTATLLHDTTLDRPLLRNVWSARSTTT